MMKKTVALAAGILLSFGAMTCVSAAETNSEIPSGLVIGLAGYGADEYQKAWTDEFISYAESLGETVISTSADSSIDKQLSDVDSLIAQSPDVIVMRPVDADGLVAAAEAVENAGIPLVISSYTINSDKYAAWVGANQGDNGVLQAQYLEDYLAANPDAKLKIGYIWGAMGISGCQERYDAVAEWVKEHADQAEIVSEKTGNWSANDAMAITEDWLQGMPEINVIICQNDEMACGVANAVNGAGKNMDDYIIMGIDGSANGLKYIKDGMIDATVLTDVPAEVRQNVDLAIDVSQGNKYEEPVYLTSYVLVTGDNISDYTE